jgi:hypothetical protein
MARATAAASPLLTRSLRLLVAAGIASQRISRKSAKVKSKTQRLISCSFAAFFNLCAIA